jgi:uncharacterized protein (UPF0147 family)
MVDITEVVEVVKELCSEKSIPKNVRSVLIEIESILLDNHTEIAVKVNAAIQKIEGISLDPNLSSFARTQVWELASVLECLLDKD